MSIAMPRSNSRRLVFALLAAVVFPSVTARGDPTAETVGAGHASWTNAGVKTQPETTGPPVGMEPGQPGAQTSDENVWSWDRDSVTDPRGQFMPDDSVLRRWPSIADGSANAEGPDISKPGVDMGDFPNSAFTLRKGRSQVEMGPVSFRTANANNAGTYAWPFLLRYGVTDDVEFRLTGNGLTSLFGSHGTTGFGVLVFDTKIHLWNDRMEYFLPAVAFEALLQTDLGSPVFHAGTEPSLNLNMDFPFTQKMNFEANLVYSGNVSSVNLIGGNVLLSQPVASIPPAVQPNGNVYSFSFLWAVEYRLTDPFKVFVHGYYTTPVGADGPASTVVGAGFFYRLSKCVTTFGSANAGLTHVPSPFLTQLGMAFAF